MSLGAALRVAAIPAVVVYPFALRVLLEHTGPRLAAAAVLFGLALSFLVRRAFGHEPLRPLAAQHALGASAALLALAQGKELALLLLPALVSLGLFGFFGATLWHGPPMIERVARRVSGGGFLEEMVPHCRQATIAWCVFFFANTGAVTALAVAAPLAWWTFYTGVVAYLLMGALFAGEYALRTVRKRRLASPPASAATSR
ncbi:MAG TPA: hypothetical protein DEP35_18465 [Deltaproteobacteria bacterium]|nr:hypothetical protein [Deltaproteobacteria bacterium]